MAKKTIEIDDSLYETASTIAKDSGYTSLNELVEEMLKELVREGKESEVSGAEKKEIEERLRKLGYMD